MCKVIHRSHWLECLNSTDVRVKFSAAKCFVAVEMAPSLIIMEFDFGICKNVPLFAALSIVYCHATD